MKNALMVFSLFPKYFGEYPAAEKAGFSVNESMIYANILCTFLSALNFLAIFTYKSYRKNMWAIFWTLIQIWSFCMIYNIGGILSFFNKLPIFSFNQNYRLSGIFVLSTIILSCLFIDKIYINSTKKISIYFQILSLLILTIGTYCLWNNHLLNAHIVTQLAVLLICLLLLSTTVFIKRKWISILAICFIAFIHSINLAGDYNGSYKFSTFYPETKLIEFLNINTSPSEKVLTLGRNLIPHTGLYHQISTIQSHWWLPPEQLNLLREINSEYKIIRPTQDFYPSLDLTEKGNTLDFLNIKYILVNEKDVDKFIYNKSEFQEILYIQGVKVFENISIPMNNDIKGRDIEGVGNLTFNKNNISFYSNNSKPNIIEIPVAAYPGWSLSKGSLNNDISLVDNRKGILTISVPSGQHKIELLFFPQHFIIFMISSLIGILLFLFTIYPIKLRTIFHSSRNSYLPLRRSRRR